MLQSGTKHTLVDECEHFESCDLPALQYYTPNPSNKLFRLLGAKMGVLTLYSLFIYTILLLVFFFYLCHHMHAIYDVEVQIHIGRD
jgi:hypothetical protein